MDYSAFFITQITVDVFLLVSILYILLASGRKGEAADQQGVKGLLDILSGRIKAANLVIEKISAEKDKGIGSTREVIKTLDAKRVEMERYLERIDKLLKAMDETLPSEVTSPSDRYREASRLAEEGYGMDEIVKMVGLPKGEVQLIVGLKKSE